MLKGLIIFVVVIFAFVLTIIIHRNLERKKDKTEEIREIMNKIIQNYTKKNIIENSVDYD